MSTMLSRISKPHLNLILVLAQLFCWSITLIWFSNLNSVVRIEQTNPVIFQGETAWCPEECLGFYFHAFAKAPVFHISRHTVILCLRAYSPFGGAPSRIPFMNNATISSIFLRTLAMPPSESKLTMSFRSFSISCFFPLTKVAPCIHSRTKNLRSRLLMSTGFHFMYALFLTPNLARTDVHR